MSLTTSFILAAQNEKGNEISFKELLTCALDGDAIDVDAINGDAHRRLHFGSAVPRRAGIAVRLLMLGAHRGGSGRRRDGGGVRVFSAAVAFAGQSQRVGRSRVHGLAGKVAI